MSDSKDHIILIKTLQDTQLPFALQGSAVSIEGQDFVFKTASGDVYKLPFAAQFAGLADDTFSLTFADGQHLTSKQLIEKAISNYSKIDVHLSQHDGNAHDVVYQDQQNHEKVIVKTVVEKVPVPDALGASMHDDASDSHSNSADNSDVTLDLIEIRPAPPPIQFGSSSGGASHAQPDNPTPTPAPGPTPNPADPGQKIFPPLNQLQLDTLTNNADHTIIAGGGSRTSSSFDDQYGARTINVSNSEDDWTIDARIRGSSNNEHTLTKIMRMDSATEITSVQANQSSNYHIVTWDSPEGQALGLAKNEFGIVYSTDSTEQFQVHVEYTPPSANGEMSHDYGFQIVSNPTSTYDPEGNVQLGTSPAPLIIRGGDGDDKIIAGHGADVYDGGDGHNTVDYSDYDHGITVDFQADNRDVLTKLGIDDTDSAKISSTGPSQVINDIQEIYGTKFDDTFITNGGNHIFHGGDGNDTFIGFGGNNVFDGGSGSNTVDYRNVGGIQFDHIDIASDIGIDFNGVEIDLSKNIASKNGWTDTKGNFGQDQLNNIHTVYGSTYNDLIICGDGDNIIYGVAGDNLIKAGNGDDKIDGGTGNSTMDYSGLSTRVDVDLNSGVAAKSQFGQDSLTNIYRIIGSAGGGSLVGRSGYSNTLIGTDGQTQFTVNGGSNTLYGGKGSNIYTATDTVVTIHGEGQVNTSNVTNSLLDYYGSANGNDTVVSQGGKSTVHAGQGHTDISFQGTSYSEIYSGNGGTITYHGGNSYTHLYLDDATITTLDYSSFDFGRFNADLATGVIQNESGASDVIYSGHISALIGTTSGSGIYDADGYAFDLSITAFNSDNIIKMGDGNNNTTTINGVGNGNNISIGSGQANSVTITEGGDNNIITGKDGALDNTILINGNGNQNKITLGSGSQNNDITIQGTANSNTVSVDGGKNNTITMGDGGSNNGNSITINDGSRENTINVNGDSTQSNISVGSGSEKNIINISGVFISNIITIDGGGDNEINVGSGGSGNIVNILDNSGDNNVRIDGDASSNSFSVGLNSNTNIFEITGNGSNNVFKISSGTHNQIYVDGTGTNNRVDYSGTTGEIEIDLSQDKALKNGSGGTDDYKGIDYIIGNAGTGNSYISKNGVNTTFDISAGNKSTIVAANDSNNKYIVTGGHGDIANYGNVSVSATFNINNNSGNVVKGSNTDSIQSGHFDNIYGTNNGDIFNIGSGMSNIHITGGDGNDKFNLSSALNTTGSIYDGGAGSNTFQYNDTTSNAFLVTITDAQNGTFSFTGAYTGTGSFTANNFDKLILSGSNPQTVDWGAGHSGIDVEILTHNANTNYNTFYVVGGGNHIDGGAGVTLTSYSFVDYSHYYSNNDTNITVNLQTGTVTFDDHRASDTLTNINAIAGSNGDDHITGHTSMSDIFYESGGSDHIDGGGGAGNIYKASMGYVHADFDQGSIAKYASDGSLLGTDTITHIQGFDSTYNSGGITNITTSSTFGMTFNLSGGGEYHLTGNHGFADMITVSGDSHLTLDYSNLTDNMTVNLTSDESGDSTVDVGKGTVHDTVNGSITGISTGSGDDIISFTHLSDLTGVSIDGGEGNNTLKLNSGGDDDLNLGGLSNVQHITNIDLTASQHDSITFNLDQFFTHNAESNVTMKINAGDVGRLNMTYDTNTWDHTQVSGNDVYTNKVNHDTFTVDHQAHPLAA